jgi:predicted Zn-dependent protease
MRRRCRTAIHEVEEEEPLRPAAIEPRHDCQHRGVHPIRGIFGARASLLIALVVALAYGGFSCSSASGGKPKKRKQVILATEYDDTDVGHDAAAEVEAEMGILPDPELTAYVTAIGRRLLRFAPHSSFHYRFQIVDQPLPNAFSLPGGGIYLSRGLLALATSEDELACVIGHEITHAAERHAAARQAISRRGLPIVAAYVRMAKLAAYSRDQEHDADRGGQHLAAAAGYDPMGMSTFLRKLGDTERLQIGYSRLPGYFDTHPGPVERSATTADRAAGMQQAQAAPEAPEYLMRINGIVLGTNPAEGIFEGNAFIHPDMQFRLRFPQGWDVFNTHQAVGAVAPTRDGWIELRAGPPAESAQEAARILREEHGREMQLRIERQLPVKIGDLEAWRIEGGSVVQGQSVHTTITLIPYNNLMFQVTSFTRSGKSDKYLARSRNTARSFAPISEAERNAVEVVRLRVVSARAGETLAELNTRTGSTLRPGEIAVLNGVFTDTRFGEGDLVKIARSEPYIGPKTRPRPD